MNLYVDILANIIIQNYFLENRCLIIFTDDQNQFEYNSTIPVVNIKVDEDVINSKHFLNYFGCQGMLIKTNNPMTVFKEFEKEIKLSLERFNKRRFVFLPAMGMKENLKDLFYLEEIKYISDLIIIEQQNHSKNCEIYNLWTHKYVGLTYNPEPILLDIWNSENKSFHFNRDLFPNKLKNQLGRTLKIATFQYEPYVIIDAISKKYKGSEMSSMLSFAKHYNMTPELVINPEDYWGIIYDNWTGNGLLGNLAADKADIGFAALYTWEADYHFLDLSNPLIRTGITCLTPAPKLAAGWLLPMYSFSNTMWFLVLTTFTTSILVHFIIVSFGSKMIHLRNNSKPQLKFSSLRNSVFTILKLFLIQLVKQSEFPAGISGAMFMGTLFIFSLFLSSFYSSGLATVMTIPTYENAIDKVSDIVDSKIYWVGTHTGWIDSIKNTDSPLYQAIVNQFMAIPSTEILREYTKTFTYALALERLPQHNYAIGPYIKSDIIESYILMSEDIYWEESVIMTRKSSILLPQLNKFISHIFEAGLINYWQNEATLLMDTHIQNAVHKFTMKARNHVVKLKWAHVAGAFTILGLGFIMSALTFLAEILVFWLSK